MDKQLFDHLNNFRKFYYSHKQKARKQFKTTTKLMLETKEYYKIQKNMDLKRTLRKFKKNNFHEYPLIDI